MKIRSLRNLAVLLLLALVPLGAMAADGDEILLRVTGEVDTPLELTRADLAAMPRQRVEMPARGEPERIEVWEGVPMIEILRAAGAPVDDRMGGRNSAAYVLVSSEDGYRAVYALAEIDPAYALERQVMVGDTLDGGPLRDSHGNLRIVNKGEGRFSRWARQVVSLEVRVAE